MLRVKRLLVVIAFFLATQLTTVSLDFLAMRLTTVSLDYSGYMLITNAFGSHCYVYKGVQKLDAILHIDPYFHYNILLLFMK